MFKLVLALTLFSYIACAGYDWTNFNAYYCSENKIGEKEMLEYNKCLQIMPKRELNTAQQCVTKEFPDEKKMKLLACYATQDKYSTKLMECFAAEVQKHPNDHDDIQKLSKVFNEFSECLFYLPHAHS